MERKFNKGGSNRKDERINKMNTISSIQVNGLKITPFLNEDKYICYTCSGDIEKSHISIVGDNKIGTSTYVTREKFTLVLTTDVHRITIQKVYDSKEDSLSVHIDLKL